MKKRFFIYFLLISFAVFFLFPIYLLIIVSFKGFEEISIESMWHLPKNLHFENYINAFNNVKHNFFNSFYLTICTTAISAILGSWNGYILAKWRFRGSDILFTLLLFGLFIPYQSILIPLHNFLQFIGLYGSIPGLILTHVIYGIPLMALIFRNYYERIPKDLIEAGRIDGGSLFGIYRYIILPISMPAFIVAIVWMVTAIWNEYLFAIVLIPDPEVQPLTVAFANMAGSRFSEWNLQMAGALIISLPPLLTCVFLQRYFIKGLLAGSIKG